MSPCPSIDILEHALGNGATNGDIQAHLSACPKCRKRARRIEENNLFLRDVRSKHSRAFDQAARCMTESETQAAPGIEGFELLREIHRGGQGVIYMARQVATRRVVAVKMLLSATLATSRQRRRFEREIEIVAGLRHPGIVTVFESGKTPDDLHWFAMEYVEGLRLDAYLREHRPDRSAILQLLTRLCDAVNYAHQRGIIHRDLKPANILVDAEGNPHVLDFGLAKALGHEPVHPATLATHAGEFMGTFAYAAPEQFEGAPDRIDTRTDVYALGAILYEAITGSHPFPTSGSIAQVVRDVNRREIIPPSAHCPDISPELEAVMLCALAAEPARRYQSAGALAQDLSRFTRGEPVEARRDSRLYLLRKAMHRHRTATLAAALTILIAIAFIVLTSFHARRVEHERDKAIAAESAAARTAANLAGALRDSNIERGRLLLRSGRVALAERILWAEWIAAPDAQDKSRPWPPDDDAYWALWELYADSPNIKTLRLPPGAVPRLDVHDRKGLLAVCDFTGRLDVRPLADLSSTLASVDFPVGLNTLAFSPDGTALAVGDIRGRISMLDPFSASARFQASAAPDGIRKICFLGDGPGMLLHLADRQIVQWGAAEQDPRPAWMNLANVAAMDTDPRGRRVAVGRNTGETRIVDPAGSIGDIVLPASNEPRSFVTVVCLSPDAERVAVGRESGATQVWDITTRRPLWTGRHHRAAVQLLDFSPDGEWIASGGYDRRIVIARANDGRARRGFTSHTGAITSVQFFDSAGMLASSATDDTVKIWDLHADPAADVIARHDKTIFQIVFGPRADMAVTCASGEDPIRLIDLPSRRQIVAMGGHRGIVACAAFSPDSTRIATGGYDRQIRIWSIPDGQCLGILKGHDDAVESLAFLDDRRLVSASDDGTLRIWSLDNFTEEKKLLGHTARCPMLALSPDRTTIASCSGDKTIRLWSAADGSLLHVLKGHTMLIRAVCFTPDGKHLLSSGDETTIRIWDLATSQCIATLDGSDHDVFSLSISPDGRFIAATTRGGAVQLWSYHRRKALATLRQEEAAVFCSAFTASGRHLAIGGETGIARLMDLTFVDDYLAGNLEAHRAVISRRPAGEAVPHPTAEASPLAR